MSQLTSVLQMYPKGTIEDPPSMKERIPYCDAAPQTSWYMLLGFFYYGFFNHRFSLSFYNTLSDERQPRHCIYALVRCHTFLTFLFISFYWFKFLPAASWPPEPPPAWQKLHWASNRTSYASHFQIPQPFTVAPQYLIELLCDVLSDPPLQPNTPSDLLTWPPWRLQPLILSAEGQILLSPHLYLASNLAFP